MNKLQTVLTLMAVLFIFSPYGSKTQAKSNSLYIPTVINNYFWRLDNNNLSIGGSRQGGEVIVEATGRSNMYTRVYFYPEAGTLIYDYPSSAKMYDINNMIRYVDYLPGENALFTLGWLPENPTSAIGFFAASSLQPRLDEIEFDWDKVLYWPYR